MTDLPAMRAEDGMPSSPEEHLDLREAKAFSHQSAVVGSIDIIDSGVGKSSGGRGAFDEVEDM